MTVHCRSRRSRCHRDRRSEALNSLRADEHRLLVFVWGQWRFRLLLLPARTAGRYQESFTVMSRLLISFFSSLALIGAGWLFAESDIAKLESVIEKHRADVVLASGGSAGLCSGFRDSSSSSSALAPGLLPHPQAGQTLRAIGRPIPVSQRITTSSHLSPTSLGKADR